MPCSYTLTGAPTALQHGGTGAWSSGIFSCWRDPQGAVRALLCSPCVAGQLLQKLNRQKGLCLCTSMLFVVGLAVVVLSILATGRARERLLEPAASARNATSVHAYVRASSWTEVQMTARVHTKCRVTIY